MRYSIEILQDTLKFTEDRIEGNDRDIINLKERISKIETETIGFKDNVNSIEKAIERLENE